jgi:cobyrinic acid a,c-diamide synthase
MIAGTHSGSGKSTITMGLLLEMKRLGMAPASFKAGPDFLDPMHHALVLGRGCRNLDTWMFPRGVRDAFLRGAEGAGISVIEGVMGLYDGVDGKSEEGSSALLAKELGAPVILVVNAAGTSRSAGAVAEGFRAYDPGVNLAGVIFNNVGSASHLRMLEDSLRGIPSLGGVLRSDSMRLESRHLGLVPAAEGYDPGRYEEIRRHVSECVDAREVARIAGSAPPMEAPEREAPPRGDRVRIGVADDGAFNFYYIQNIEMLQEAGAEIVRFSPMRDALPDVDGLYLGGGYPELFAPALEANARCRAAVRKASGDGMPIYAECGGLMYLCSRLEDLDGREHEMSGAFGARSVMRAGRKTLGYVEAASVRDTPLCEAGRTVRGHEFHYSATSPSGEEYAWELRKGKGIEGGMDGFLSQNTLAGYTHIHFAASPGMPARFAEACRRYGRS